MSEENRFLVSVQKGSVPHPPQRSFTIQKWTKAYAAIENPSLVDQRLYESGLYFYERLKEAREKHGALPQLGIESFEHVQLLVAAVNRVAHLDYKYTSGRISDEARYPDESESLFGPAVQAHRSDFASRSVQLIDAIRHVLPEAAKHDQAQGKRLEDAQLLEAIGSEVELGRLYEALGTGWLECLWADYYVDSFEEGEVVADTLMPQNWERDRIRALGDFRRDSLLAEFGIHAAANWSRLPAAMRQSLMNEPVVKRIVWDRGVAKPILGRRGSLGVAPPMSFVARIVANEPYFQPLLNEPLPNLGNLTLLDLLNAWAMLASLGEVMENRISKANIHSVRDAVRWAPLITIAGAQQMLVEALNLSTEQARIAVEAQILPFNARSDPWVRPWVQVGTDHITPLFHALQASNLIRCLERWLDEGGISLSRRGKLFENTLRLELQAALELPDASVTDRAIRVRSDGAFEEIDLVIRVGATFLIGECKCSVYPVGAHGYLTYEQILSEAAEQARRKADFCRQHPDALLTATGNDAMRETEITILPVVVTNVPHGVGHLIDGVPVSDSYILTRYLDGGGNYFRRATLDRFGIRTGDAVQFYASPDEAPSRLEGYLADPPQLYEARDWLKLDVGEWIPQHMLERPLYFVGLRVKPELPASVTGHGGNDENASGSANHFQQERSGDEPPRRKRRGKRRRR